MKVKGGWVSNYSGTFITDEEFEALDPEFRYYVYEEEVLWGEEEHLRDTFNEPDPYYQGF